MPNRHMSRDKRYKYVEDAGYDTGLVKEFDDIRAEEIACLNGYVDEQDLTSFSSISSALNAMMSIPPKIAHRGCGRNPGLN